MFRAQSAHHQEVNDVNCTYAASGIVTLCKWLSCATAKEGLQHLCIKLVIIKKFKLCYVQTSNIVLGQVSKLAVHFYTDFTSRLLKQIWLFPYPYGFYNPVRIHGMKINDMILWPPDPWRRRIYVLPKCRQPHSHQHGVTFQRTVNPKTRTEIMQTCVKLAVHIHW